MNRRRWRKMKTKKKDQVGAEEADEAGEGGRGTSMCRYGGIKERIRRRKRRRNKREIGAYINQSIYQ